MIEARLLNKSYGRAAAARDVSFEARRNEIVALVGPNGAGKSTVLKILSTYLRPDSGGASINGIDVVKDPLAARMNVGYMPENSIAYEGMRVDRFLKFIAESRRLSGADLKKQFDWAVDHCRIESVLHKRVGQCSKGFQRRVALAMSIIHNPDALLLDEPTHGLDPLQVMGLREFIKGLKKDKAIIFSSHIFQEVVAICDRAIVMNDSRILADGTIAELALQTGRRPSYSCSAEAPEDKLRSFLSSMPGCSVIHLTAAGGRADFEAESASAAFEKELADGLSAMGCGSFSVERRPLDFEMIFADLIKQSGGEAA